MNDIIIFDTETTGLLEPITVPLHKQPKMIEFAAIKLNKELKEIDRLEFLINPGIPIPAHITKITNITNDMVKNAGTFVTYLDNLQDFFLGVREFVAHNLMFDHDILSFELQRLDRLTQFPWPFIRTCTIEQTFHLHGYRLNLAKLYHYCFQKNFENAHRAMADVEALTQCYIHLKNENII